MESVLVESLCSWWWAVEWSLGSEWFPEQAWAQLACSRVSTFAWPSAGPLSRALQRHAIEVGHLLEKDLQAFLIPSHRF
eukprot:1542724-Amphidinium_carterae.1